MFEYLGELLSAVMSLFPRLVIIRSTHAGVKFRHGKHILKLGPGITVYWPLVTEIEILPVKRQTKKLDPQYLTTQDGISVGIRGLVVYEVSCPVDLLTRCWDYDETIDDLAQAAIRDTVQGKEWEHLDDNLEEKLLWRLTADLCGFGVNVVRVTVTDLVKVRPWAILGPPPWPQEP